MYGLIKEQMVTLPTTVTDSYSAKDCDELHAFQGTNGKVIGNMNVTVGNKLQEIYNSGVSPKVTNVKVEVNGMTVTWTVTIDKSNDGKAWVGFTSRGAGCNNDIINRAVSASHGNDSETAKTNIKSTYGELDIEIEIVNDFIYSGATTGKNSFRQVFYRYTKPINNPPKGYQQQKAKAQPNPKPQPNQQTNGNKKITITATGIGDLRDKLKNKTKGMSIDLKSVNLDIDNFTVTFNLGNQKVENLSILWSNESDKELILVYKNVVANNPGLRVKSLGESQEVQVTQEDNTVGTFYCVLVAFL